MQEKRRGRSEIEEMQITGNQPENSKMSVARAVRVIALFCAYFSIGLNTQTKFRSPKKH